MNDTVSKLLRQQIDVDLEMVGKNISNNGHYSDDYIRLLNQVYPVETVFMDQLDALSAEKTESVEFYLGFQVAMRNRPGKPSIIPEPEMKGILESILVGSAKHRIWQPYVIDLSQPVRYEGEIPKTIHSPEEFVSFMGRYWTRPTELHSVGYLSALDYVHAFPADSKVLVVPRTDIIRLFVERNELFGKRN